MRRLLFPALILATGCSDALEQTSSAGQVVGFSDLGTLSLVSAVGFSVTTVNLSPGFGYVAVAGRGTVILVLRGGGVGNTSRVDLLDLAQGDTPSGFTLSGNSQGGAIQDDSIAWVAVSDQGAVARVNYREQATRASIRVGGAPQSVVITAGRVFVVNSSGASSWISAIDPVALLVVDSIPLTGGNAGPAVVGGDSLVYVIETGSAGAGGRVSIVDPVVGQELALINGLSPDATSPVYHPSGRLLVASPTDGILEVNTLTGKVTRGPALGKKPGGHGVAALSLDNGGRVYAGDVDCSVIRVLSGPPDYQQLQSVSVAGCPSAAAVASTP